MTTRSQCSRAGCRADATTQIVWRNPRIHSADREKIWLACEQHHAFLTEYLRSRGFPVAERPHTETAEDA